MDQTRIGDRTARQTLILLDIEINSLNHSKLSDRAVPPRPSALLIAIKFHECRKRAFDGFRRSAGLRRWHGGWSLSLNFASQSSALKRLAWDLTVRQIERSGSHDPFNQRHLGLAHAREIKLCGGDRTRAFKSELVWGAAGDLAGELFNLLAKRPVGCDANAEPMAAGIVADPLLAGA